MHVIICPHLSIEVLCDPSACRPLWGQLLLHIAVGKVDDCMPPRAAALVCAIAEGHIAASTSIETLHLWAGVGQGQGRV